MTSYGHICTLCSDSVSGNVKIINTNMEEMLHTLLINIDVSSNENHVICKTCQNKLENNYSFKKKCLFVEETLNPFITENVKIDLNDIHNQIIKSADVEMEKNVCRLCFEYSDDDMTLSTEEKQQFQQHFPEINLNLTNLVLVCATCYNTLQKYFIFVTSCLSSEEQLSVGYNSEQNFGHQSGDCQESSVNATKLNVDMKIKHEEQSCSSSMVCDKEQINSTKCEEDDDKITTLLHEELDIKSEEVSIEDGCRNSNFESIKTSFNLQPHKMENEMQGLSESDSDKINCKIQQKNVIVTVNTSSYKMQIYQCVDCGYYCKSKSTMKDHILFRHTEACKIQKYKCEQCDYVSNRKWSLKAHILRQHTDKTTLNTDRSKIKIYQCEACDYNCNRRYTLKNHILYQHTDPSKIQMHKCEECNFKSKYYSNLKSHILTQHGDLMKTHTDTSNVKIYQCEVCSFETKTKSYMKNHILLQHTDPSKIEMYKCSKCNFKSKRHRNLQCHVQRMHTNPSETKIYKCDKCDCQFKMKDDLLILPKSHCTNDRNVILDENLKKNEDPMS